MAESMGPDAIAQLLTEYFTEMVEIIFEHGGTLDKFMGDAIMALWGAPIAHADDPDRALRAAVDMQQAIARLNERWVSAGPARDRRRHRDQPRRGVRGKHRQPPAAGYTVIGDAVNVAARLCAEAGPGEILVSEALCGW